eukprot:gene7414-7623_t
MAFMGSKQEQLCGLARKYVEAWGSATSRGIDVVKQELQGMITDDVVFKADGVVYTQDLQGLPAVLKALEREHGLYEHTTYYPVAVAANEDDNTAFVGVAWEYKNIGAYPGANEPTNRLSIFAILDADTLSITASVSRGFSIKQLTFDPSSGKLKESRVNRQMTTEEQQALVNPGVKCQPADVFADVLPKLGRGAQAASEKPIDEPDFAGRMRNSLMTWVHCWSSDTDVEQLDNVLDPAFMAYDAYGLHQAANRPEREGHAISMMGREDAKASITELHRKFDDRNKLISFAVSSDMRVAFDHWQGEAHGRDSGASFVVEGVDMILFTEQGKISTLVQFDMQDYSKQLRGQADAPAGVGKHSI